MRMQTGRWLMPNRMTGVITLLFFAAALVVTYLEKALPLFVAYALYLFAAGMASTIMEPAEIHEKADKGYLATLTRSGIFSGFMLCFVQLTLTTGLIHESGSGMDGMLFTACVLVVVNLVGVALYKRGTLPKQVSNVTSMLLIAFYCVATVAAYVRYAIPGSLWPNVVMHILLCSYAVGFVCYLVTGKKASGFMGASWMHICLAGSIVSIVEAYVREEYAQLSPYVWVGMACLLPILMLYSAADYYIFAPRRPKIVHIKEK